MEKYDPNKHYHIGYYEDGYDLEVTAYKRINEPVWDAYLPHYEVDDFKKVEKMKLGEYIDDYGIKVYSFSNDIDDEEARTIFENWLKRMELFKDKMKRRLLSCKIVISFSYSYSKFTYLLSLLYLLHQKCILTLVV